MAQIADRLGNKIEPKILPLVIALNALGIPTMASCQGHAEKNTVSFPWIGIGDTIQPAQEQKVLSLFKRADYFRNKKQLTKARQYQTQAELLWQQTSYTNQLLGKKVLTFLNTYYQQFPQKNYLLCLQLTSFNYFDYKLTSAVSELSLAYPLKMQKHLLKQTQKEMLAFAKFLRQRYS